MRRAPTVIAIVVLLGAPLGAWAWSEGHLEALASPTTPTTTWTTPATTTTRPKPTTTTYAYAPRVASPFTDREIDFLNALVEVGLYGFIGANWRTEFHHEGIDQQGIGRIHRGWHELDLLEDYVQTVELGHILCDREDRDRFLDSLSGKEERQQWKDFALVARAWLC